MSSENNRNPFNVWWFVSGGFLVLVLVAVIAAFALRGTGGDEDGEEPQPTIAQSATTGPAGEGGCSLPSSEEYPTVGPEAEWELVANTIQLPRSPEHGPQIVEGDSTECFAHSPTGALFAGMTRATEVFYLGDTESAATDPASQQVAESYAGNPDDGGVQDSGVITGFKFLDYTGDAATISYRLEQADVVAETSVTVVWDESKNDWLVDLSAGEPGMVEIPSSDQSFTDWGP